MWEQNPFLTLRAHCSSDCANMEWPLTVQSVRDGCLSLSDVSGFHAPAGGDEPVRMRFAEMATYANGFQFVMM